MKFSSQVFLFALFLPFTSGNLQECVDEVVDGKDYFDVKVVPEISALFSVSYEDTYKIVTNIAANETYLLYQCGTESPVDKLDGPFDAVVSVPIEDVGLLYTTMIPFVELIGARKSTSAFFGSASWVSSPCLIQLLDEGSVQEVLDPTNQTKITNVPLDLPSFVGHFGDYAFNNTFRISVTEEDTNLGAFEWIKFYSLFFNLEEKATQIFEATKQRYKCAEANADLLSCDEGGAKPLVLWGSYSAYCGGWDVAKCPNYYCEFAEACASVMLHSEEGSIQSELCGANYMTTEEFVAFGKEADFWIYTSYDINDVLANFEEDLKDFVSVNNKQVFDTKGGGENAWFEQRLAEPDVVLQDFCTIVGKENQADPVMHTRAWFRNVYDEAVGSLGQCIDPDAAMITKATACAALPSTFCSESPVDDSSAGGPKMLLSLAIALIAVLY